MSMLPVYTSLFFLFYYLILLTLRLFLLFFFFFFNDTATTEIYTLSLHDALPICRIAPFAAQIPALAGEIDHRHAAMVVVIAAVVMSILVAVVMSAAVQMVAMGVAALEAVVVARPALPRRPAPVAPAHLTLPPPPP